LPFNQTNHLTAEEEEEEEEEEKNLKWKFQIPPRTKQNKTTL
jgi:hypothetical protein